jgi:hypothetical protein
MVDLNRHTHVAQQSTDADQLTTLIREVAAMRKWHDSVHMSILYDTDARRSMLNSREATDSNPDLQARIAREMESQ